MYCYSYSARLHSLQNLFKNVLLELPLLRISSSFLVNRLVWQEPCIVFCPHWSLRIGPAVHLLHRWCGDENSLLVMEVPMKAPISLGICYHIRSFAKVVEYDAIFF